MISSPIPEFLPEKTNLSTPFYVSFFALQALSRVSPRVVRNLVAVSYLSVARSLVAARPCLKFDWLTDGFVDELFEERNA